MTKVLPADFTDGKGLTKEYHLSKSAPLPLDLLPLIDLLESEEGVNENVLSGLNDQILFSEDQLSALIATFAPGDEVTLKWMRGAGEMTTKTTLTAANPRPPRPALGPEAAEYIERQFGSEVLMLLEAVASNPQIVAQLPIIEDVIQLDDEGSIRWKTEAASGIRKHLAAHAAELLPGFDRMLIELNTNPDVENLVDQMGKELKKASPEIRKRITNLVGKMMADLMRGIEEQ